MKPKFANEENNAVLDAIVEEQFNIIHNLINLKCTELATQKQIDLDNGDIPFIFKFSDGKQIRTLSNLDELTDDFASIINDKFISGINEDPKSFKPFSILLEIVEFISRLDLQVVSVQSFEA